MGKTICEDCLNYSYDMEYDEYYCACYDSMDQDEAVYFKMGRSTGCPMYRPGDEYSTVRRQI